jgi:hypothetical protein
MPLDIGATDANLEVSRQQGLVNPSVSTLILFSTQPHFKIGVCELEAILIVC